MLTLSPEGDVQVTKRYSERENLITMRKLDACIFSFSAKTVNKLDGCLQVHTQQSVVVNTAHE